MSLGAYSNTVTEPVNKQVIKGSLTLDSLRVKLKTFGILGFVLSFICSSAFAKDSVISNSDDSNQKQIALYLQGPELSLSNSTTLSQEVIFTL